MAAPPIPSITGGAATATSGDASGQSRSGFTTGPVVIGGYKTDGSATAIPSWLLAAGVAAAGLVLWLVFRRK